MHKIGGDVGERGVLGEEPTEVLDAADRLGLLGDARGMPQG